MAARMDVNIQDLGKTWAGNKKALSPNLLFASFCAYLGGMSFGFMIGYSSPAIPDMEQQGVIDKDQSSWFGSIATVGALLGCPLAGWLVERIGRKATLLVITVPFFFGWGMIYIGDSSTMLYLGRILTGVGSGMVTVTCPMYIAEGSTKETRGMLGSGVQLSITIGILIVYALGMELGYQSLALMGMAIPFAAVIFTFRTAETPRYFLLHGKKQDALRSLTWFRGPQPNMSEVEDEIRDIEESLDPEDKISWSEFRKPELKQPLIVTVGLMVFQQLTGINVIMFYTVSIFQSVGFKENATFATIIIGVVQVVGTFVACLLMDRAGRRALLLLAGAGMALTTFTFGLYFYLDNGMNWLAMGSLIVYIVAFSLGWGPIPMLVMSEIFPVRARGRASAIATIMSWSSAFIMTKEFSLMQQYLGQHGAFWMFCAGCLLGQVFVWKSVPETKGKSLEDIELYFVGRAIRGI